MKTFVLVSDSALMASPCKSAVPLHWEKDPKSSHGAHFKSLCKTFWGGTIMTRSLRIALVSISLSFGSLAISSLGTSSANAASKASLRTFCIDYQDFVTFNPTGMSEWKMQLSAVKTLEHEAPASMKSVLKSTAGLLQTFINQNLHLTKTQARTAKNLDREDQSKEQSLCSKYSGTG